MYEKTIFEIIMEADEENDSTDYTEAGQTDPAPTDKTDDTGDENTDTTTDDNTDTGDDTEEVDPEETGSDEPTDYTEDSPGLDDTGGDTSTDTDTGTDGMSSDDMSNPEDDEEARKKSSLLNNFIELYGICKSLSEKASKADVKSINANKIISQLSNNLREMKKEIYNYIVYRYDKDSYIINLYKYNHAIQNMNINVEIAKKSRDFKPQSQNNNVITKEGSAY